MLPRRQLSDGQLVRMIGPPFQRRKLPEIPESLLYPHPPR